MTDEVAWRETYEDLVEADERGPLDVEDLERLAVAAYFVGRDEESAAAWERAHRTWTRLGDPDRAARCAFWLGLFALLRAETAVASGWFSRGRRLVDDAPPCAGRGYLLVPAAMEALANGDLRRAGALYDEVWAIAQACGDVDLRALGLLGRGEVAIAAGEARRGLALLDEVMIAATAGESSPLMTGVLYCAVIDACVQALDLRRAAEWTDALAGWCDRQPDLVPFRGQCLVHRAQVLQARGAWGEALAEAAQASRRLTRPPHPAAGVAFYQQGEVHRLRGEFDRAEAAYQLASEHGFPPTPGLALLRLAEGRVDAARAAVARMLDEGGDEPHRLAVLPAAVEIFVAAGDVERARSASDELQEAAGRHRNEVVDALAAHADALVSLAEGDASRAVSAARRACDSWRRLAMPYEGARSQLLAAEACRALGDADAAAFERAAARAAFERLGAAPDAARCASDDGAPAVTLTAREREVLRLVAHGKTNREIGSALIISEHTVARHVQNAFAKLGVSSRAAATAYCYEHGIL